MLILGLLLLVVSGAAGVLLIAYNNGGAEQTVTMFGRDWTNATMMEAFVAGMVVAVVFLLGLWMIAGASRRARENRARYREVRNEAKVASRERDQLAEQLRREEDRRESVNETTVTQPVAEPVGTPVSSRTAGAPPTPRHAAPAGQQPVITNIKPGDSPTK
ncbi:hypothetical protein [Actinophytocola oryzae]|uniref:Uncharacterized protein n=1 Tax=Actinophytocola oryzae TaxID=502181 RepID=A0A4R7VQJ3_9PSEU|nr:hypothetical protein [Actinophytocola oryzae]TDV51944.1 hypothetical protein CLV71_10573 [Actinophytocola oryzae]